jgi:hypothetical protein
MMVFEIRVNGEVRFRFVSRAFAKAFCEAFNRIVGAGAEFRAMTEA